MRIDPAIAELRRNAASQLRAQSALEAVRDAWRRKPDVAALLDDLGRYGEGAPFGSCPSLGAVFLEPALGRVLVDDVVAPMLDALAEYPLGHVPFRHQATPGLLVLQLAAAGRATLSLLCYQAQTSGAGREPARTVCFAGGERRELCLAGAADAHFFEILREEPDRADLHLEPRRIAAGEILVFEGPRHARIVDRPRRRMVMLRLARTDIHAVASREYRIADGALVHCAAGDGRESRDEMAAAVLGAMGRADAAPVLAGIAQAPGSDHLRWQALRQALTLDTATGFSALNAIAGDAADSLAPPAGALRASLIEQHPALARWSAQCPVS